MYPGCREAATDSVGKPCSQEILMVWRQAAELGPSLANILTKVKRHLVTGE